MVAADVPSDPDVEKQQPLSTTKADELASPGCCCFSEYCYRKARACFWPAAPLALAVVLLAGTAQLVARDEDYLGYALFALQALVVCVVTSFLARCAMIIPADPDHHQLDGGSGRLVHAWACAVAEHVLEWSFAMLCVVTLVMFLAVVFAIVQSGPAAA